MTEKALTCPVCGQDDHTYKVSQIYLESLMRMKHSDKAETPVLDHLKAEIPTEKTNRSKEAHYYREAMESFAPPQGASQVIRSINPDWAAFVMGLLSIYILYQIYLTQTSIFWYMLAFAVVMFAAYIIFHKQIVGKYKTEKSNEAASKEQVEKAIGYWMKLYYCSRDQIVFGWKKDDTAPFEQMNAFLIQSAKKK